MKLLSLLTRLMPIVVIALLITYKESTGKPLAGVIDRVDTIRASLLVTLRPMGVAHHREGYAVVKNGNAITFLDCRKSEVKLPIIVWEWRAR
jgi:hypothetical protein